MMARDETENRASCAHDQREAEPPPMTLRRKEDMIARATRMAAAVDEIRDPQERHFLCRVLSMLLREF
jgi:hypothetical protein